MAICVCLRHSLRGELVPSRRVWFVCELYYPETTSTGWYLTGLCEALAQDFQIGVICCQPNYSAKGVQAAAEETRHGVRIVRCQTPQFDTNRLWTRAWMWLLQAMRMGRAMRRHVARDDLVVVLTNPPLLPHVVRLLLRGGGRRLVVYAQDMYPQALVCAGLIRRGGMANRVLQLAARTLYRSVAAVVVDGRDSLRELATHVRAGDLTAFVPYWAEADLLSARPSADAPRLVIGYSGTLGRIHDVTTLLDSATELRAADHIRWKIRGTGPRLREVQTRVAEQQLGAVELLPPKPWSELREVFVDCDLCIITLAREARAVGTPSRVYNALAAARPIIVVAEPDTELAMLVADTGSGWVTPPGDSRALSALVLRLASDPQLVADAAKRALAASASYTRERSVADFRQILERVASRPA